MENTGVMVALSGITAVMVFALGGWEFGVWLAIGVAAVGLGASYMSLRSRQQREAQEAQPTGRHRRENQLELPEWLR